MGSLAARVLAGRRGFRLSRRYVGLVIGIVRSKRFWHVLDLLAHPR